MLSCRYGQAWTVNLEEGTSETWMDGGAPSKPPLPLRAVFLTC